MTKSFAISCCYLLIFSYLCNTELQQGRTGEKMRHEPILKSLSIKDTNFPQLKKSV